MIENNFEPYACVSVQKAITLARYGVYYECDADQLSAWQREQDRKQRMVGIAESEEAIAYANRR